ncbi:MAG: hypothetical protein HN463_11110 [Gemmatimonadales bacterium]|nr:hypothetical protein [Gemmatimonadales bacterium]
MSTIGRLRNKGAILRILFLALMGVGHVASAAAQEVVAFPLPGEAIYEVRLTDGSLIYGRVTDVSGDRVSITTSAGVELDLQRSQIRQLSAAEGRFVDGEFWREDPNGTRLFFTATGRAIPAGEAYLGTYFLFLPFVAVGVSDDFTLAAGAPVLFGKVEPFYLAPKVRIVDTEAADISLGTIVFFLDNLDNENIGIAYGVGTFGSRDRALTAGLGLGYSGVDFSSQPVAMIGGETRVSRRVKLMTENYFLPGETGLVFSGGMRIIGERFSTDLGVVGTAGAAGGTCCVPIVNFSYSFGLAR